MKRKLLATILALGLTTGAALASKYLQKPQDGGTSNALIKLGNNVDEPVTTVTTATIDDNGDLSTSGAIIYTGSALGTANTANGIVATISGNKDHAKITLDLDNVTIGTFDNGTNINGSTLNGAMGISLFTFDDNGVFLVEVSSVDLEDVTCSTSNGTALTDTPDIGIGTAQATSQVAVLLSAITNGENIHTGQTLTGINGETLDSTLAGLDFLVDTDAEGTLYLNVADKYAVDLNGETLKVNNGSITFFVQYVYDKDHAD